MLDLHNNDLATLPDELGYLTNLQVLNLEHNKLKSLPHSLEYLKCLRTLNCKGKVSVEFFPFKAHRQKMQVAFFK